MRGQLDRDGDRGVGQIGAYRIERVLGRGGFGIVYAGVDTRLDRRAAIKQLLPELSRDREMVERFFNEAKAAAGIDHPGIVEIYDVGWHADSAYFAMKLLDGESLGLRVSAGPLPVAHACGIARQVASALAAAHARGIVHRDLKPDNIILVPDDEVAIGERAIVLDFGIAKLSGEQPVTHRTRTGMVMGSPSYMSPEQCRGSGEIDHRTDVYALGCILFEMLAGRPPFVSEAGGEVMGMHLFVAPPELGLLRPDVPRELVNVVMRSLAKLPQYRPADMTTMLAALRPFAAGGTTARPAMSVVPPPRRGVRSRHVLIASIVAFACTIAGGAILKHALEDAHADQPAHDAATVTPHVPPAPTPPVAVEASRKPDALEQALTARDLPAARLELAKLSTTDRESATTKVQALETALIDEVAAELRPLAGDCTRHGARLREVEQKHGPSVATTARGRVPCVVAARPPDPLKEAREAQLGGNHAKALARAELVLARQPGNAFARAIAATAACNLRDLHRSATHIAALAGYAQRAARDTCARNGVQVDIGSPLPRPPAPRPPPRPFNNDDFE